MGTTSEYTVNGKKRRKMKQLPEIFYETPNFEGEKVSPIPYVVIPADSDMPPGLFLMEYRETNETENGQPMMEGPWPHMYVDFKEVEEALAAKFGGKQTKAFTDVVDHVRAAIGLEPLKVAKKKGNELLDNAGKIAEEIVNERIAARSREKVGVEK
jgi:hypothetical protein